jgi:predicted RecA/RadA family phage recombinase
MAEYTPLFDAGRAITMVASATITGGQLVRITGNDAVAPTSAASADWFGVASNDAVIGQHVTVYRMGVQRLVVSPAGTITAGTIVEGAANGQAAAHTNGTNDVNSVGLALTTAAPGALVEVSFRR